MASIWYRANKSLNSIHSQIWGEDDTFSIEALSNDGTKAYVLSNRVGRPLWLYDIESGEFEKLLFSDDKYDLDSGITNNEGEFIGVSYFDDYYQTCSFSEEDGKRLNGFKPFKGKQATISSQIILSC